MNRTTLIITKEKPKLNDKLTYFHSKSYLAIKFHDLGIDSGEIEKLATKFDCFNDIFDAFVRDFFTDDGVNLDDEYYNDLDWNDHEEKISLVEFIKRLKLSTFIIYHITYFDFGATSHLICFEDSKVVQNGKFVEAWKKSKFKAFK